MDKLILIGEKAKKASYLMSNVSSITKDNALEAIANALTKNEAEILKANEIDLQNARAKGISGALLDRLTLSKERILSIAQGVLQIKSLPDPIGEVISMWKRPNNLTIGQKRVPLGVIGIIYEARPNVTVDAAALCLKAGNAVVLRGGSEAIHSNTRIVEIMQMAVA